MTTNPSRNGIGFAQHTLQRMEHELLVGAGFTDYNALVLFESRLPSVGIDQWIAPHKMLQQEKEINGIGLTSIVFGQQRVEPLKSFQTFNREKLEQVLVLDPIRKHNILNINPTQEEAKMHPTKRQRTTAPKAPPTLPPVIISDQARSAMTKTGSSASLSSAVIPVAITTTAPAPSSSTAVNRQQARVGLPSNFNAVVRTYFNKNFFDGLELPYHVSFIFFSKATASNFREFYLDSPQDACNLLNIHEKLNNKTNQKYKAVDEFVMDFKLFYHNVVDRLPADHDAVKEAMILKEKFDREWPEVESKFRWTD